MWLERGRVTFIRNNYKTSNTYGTKTDVISDEKFLTAMKRMKTKIGTNNFIPNPDDPSYYVKKSTYKQIGEGAYFKILVDSNRGDLQKLKSMGNSRGTALDTIATNYDIALVELDQSSKYKLLVRIVLSDVFYTLLENK